MRPDTPLTGRHGLIPLGGTPGSRFLPWILGLMGFLGCLAIAAVISLAGLAERWQSGFEGAMTVELDPVDGHGADQDGRLDAALLLLRQQPGVLSATPLSVEDQADALSVWLDDPSLLKDIRLPQLIELKLDTTRAGDKQLDAQPLDAQSLEARLAAEVAGIRVTDQQQLITGLLWPAQLIEAYAYAILIAVFMASMLLASFSARSTLSSHVRLISLLHLIGAADRDIAREIQWHILWRGGIGALSGLAAAVICLIVTAGLMAHDWPSFLPRLTLAPGLMTGVLLFPVVLLLLAVATARLTVMHELARDH